MTIGNTFGTSPFSAAFARSGACRIGAGDNNIHDLITRVVPTLLGHHPGREQLVVITLTGRAFAAHAVVSFPEPRRLSERLGPELAADAAVTLPLLDAEPLWPGADGVILIGYGDRDRDDDLLRIAELVPVPVLALLRVDAEHWSRLDHPADVAARHPHISAARHNHDERRQDPGADR